MATPRPPKPPDFVMNALYCYLLPCDLTKEQWLNITAAMIEFQKTCAHAELVFLDQILGEVTGQKSEA